MCAFLNTSIRHLCTKNKCALSPAVAEHRDAHSCTYPCVINFTNSRPIKIDVFCLFADRNTTKQRRKKRNSLNNLNMSTYIGRSESFFGNKCTRNRKISNDKNQTPNKCQTNEHIHRNGERDLQIERTMDEILLVVRISITHDILLPISMS